MRKQIRKISVLLGGLLASVLLTTACNNAGDNNDTNTSESESTTKGEKGTITNPLNVSEAIAKCEANDESVRYYIRAKVKEIVDANYGQMVIEDETGSLSVYGTYSADGEKRYSELDEKPTVGDTVILYGNLVTFKNSPEIKSGWIISFEKGSTDFDPNNYEAVSISEARNKTTNSLVKVTGVVAKITYASGLKPNGIYLVDGTNSIYVYDSNGTITGEVEIGNTVTLCGMKTYYILDSEKNAASKFGYKGCNQLVDCTIVSNDKKQSAVDYSWVKESTVKNVMNTSVTSDITSTIFKVNALIKKSQGDGFVNYYINDLDEVTGSYVYTQSNGNDLDYLEKFDGKICTVYLSAINAKSTDSGCVWRFIPINVVDESYKFDLSKTQDFVMDYYAEPQIKSVYEGDPNLELISSVSSTLLGFDNATISYSSGDENVVKFEVLEGKYVMHTVNYGTSKVTITVTYNGVELTKEINVSYKAPTTYDTINISEVYTKDYDTLVYVKGVVAGGVTNQKALYLVDETGMIAVRTTEEALSSLHIGDEIVVKGKYVNYSGEKIGQLHLEDAEVLSILSGNNNYSTDSFTESTLKEVSDLCTAKDTTATGKVYVISAKVVENVQPKYSTIYLEDENGNQLLLYTSSSSQYSWLLEYSNISKFEITVNAWNGKYKASVVAIILEDGTKVSTQGAIGK